MSPKCQTFAKEQWIQAQNDNLLNVGYFHIVFSIPNELNSVMLQNQQVMYSVFFKAVSETLLELAADNKYLGAKIGITTILHTWGQNLNYHPHIHCIVPGGGLVGSVASCSTKQPGLTKDGKWCGSRKNFFLPVKVMSRKFRGKFLHYFNKAKLMFYGINAEFENPQNFSNLLDCLYHKEWYIYCKPPFKSSSKVIEYLGRYTHRVAISNNRIMKFENNLVTFKWRDYADNNKIKLMTLTSDEFIRRFLLHILPSGFMKIRHYGLLASRDKNRRISICKKLTNTNFNNFYKSLSILQRLVSSFGKDFNLCPRCNKGHLIRTSPV